MPTLSTAQAYILRKRNPKTIDTYAYLLAELAALDVVRIQTVYERPHPTDAAIVRYDYLMPGINFDRYPLSKAQAIIIEEVRQSQRLPLHILAKALRNGAEPQGLIGQELDHAGMTILGIMRLRTIGGRALHRTVKRELKTFSRNFPLWLSTHPEKLKECVARLGLLLLLAPGLDFASLAKLAPLFEAETWPQASAALEGPVFYNWGNIMFPAQWEAFAQLESQIYKFEQAFNRVKANKDRRLDFYFGGGNYH